jgi:hypothetical protein
MQKMKLGHEPSCEKDSMEKLLAKLSEQQKVLNKQNEALKLASEEKPYHYSFDYGSSSNSLPMTPATEIFPTTAPTTRPASASLNETGSSSEEVLRLKLELAQAQNKISRLDQELADSRVSRLDSDAASVRPGMSGGREGSWLQQDDTHSDTSDAISVPGTSRARGIWANSKAGFQNSNITGQGSDSMPATWLGGRGGFGNGYVEPNGSYNMMDYRNDRVTPDPDMVIGRHGGGRRGNRFDSRFGSHHSYNGPYGNYTLNPSQFDIPNQLVGGMGNIPNGPGGMGMYSQYQHQPIGTPLSPHATEFTSNVPWKNEVDTS